MNSANMNRTSSYRTSSCAPGTPTPPAAHLPARSITAGSCSPESGASTLTIYQERDKRQRERLDLFSNLPLSRQVSLQFCFVLFCFSVGFYKSLLWIKSRSCCGGLKCVGLQGAARPADFCQDSQNVESNFRRKVSKYNWKVWMRCKVIKCLSLDLIWLS